MKYKIFLFFMISVFFVNVISATPLIVTPSNLNLNVTRSQTTTININITNQNNFVLKDVKIIGDFATSNIISTLNINETKQLNVNILVPNAGTFSRSYRIEGLSEINCTLLGSIESNINIFSNGAQPRNLQICQNSNVRFTNQYGNSIRLLIESLSIDVLLANSSMHVQNFNTNGNYVYRIEPFIDIGTIAVTDAAQLIHRTEDDGLLNLNIVSTASPTDISLSFNAINFSMRHTDILSSFFIIKNNGSSVAENIRFFADWISFDRNNFNLAANEERAVNFVISPTISDSTQTNKTYSKEIIVRGNNFGEKRYNITIFIEFSGLVAGNISSPAWWIERKRFCDTHPTAPDCLTEPIILYRDKEVFDCPAILANVSPNDVQNSFQQCNALRDDFSDVTANLNEDTDFIKNLANNIFNVSSDTSSKTSANTEVLTDFRNTFYLILGILFLLVFVSSSGFVIYKYYIFRRMKHVSDIQ